MVSAQHIQLKSLISSNRKGRPVSTGGPVFFEIENTYYSSLANIYFDTAVVPGCWLVLNNFLFIEVTSVLAQSCFFMIWVNKTKGLPVNSRQALMRSNED